MNHLRCKGHRDAQEEGTDQTGRTRVPCTGSAVYTPGTGFSGSDANPARCPSPLPAPYPTDARKSRGETCPNRSCAGARVCVCVCLKDIFGRYPNLIHCPPPAHCFFLHAVFSHAKTCPRHACFRV